MAHNKKGSIRFETQSIHRHPETGPYPYRSVTPPIISSSTFDFDSVAEFNQEILDTRDGFFYARRNNPTTRDAEMRMAALEGCDNGALFSSGMAAISTTVLSMIKAGDHVVVFKDVYGGAVNFFTNVLPLYGVEVSWVDTGDYQALEEAMRPNTKVIYFESPTNPLLKIVDIGRVAEIGKRHEAQLIFDNTLTTPYLQKPLELGADLVVYSATKYLCGHSDMILGAATGDENRLALLHTMRAALGPITDPRSAFMLSRSLATLGVRLDRHCDNAERVAEFLAGHSRVKTVYFPGVAEISQRRLAEQQMQRFGAMVSFELSGTPEEAEQLVDRLELITFGASLGGVESLIQPSRLGTHRKMSPENRAAIGVGEGLLRLSVGLENASDIINDLRQALNFL